MTFFCSFS